MPNYKYDATVFLPINAFNKKRTDLYNKIGILNCRNNKILLCFLTGRQLSSQKEIEDLYPKYVENENIDLKYIPYTSDHPAAKVYDFYLKKEFYSDSKWIVKIDDDTSTDVDAMMKFLSEHDQEKEYVFISKFSDGNLEITKEVLEKYGLYEKISFLENKSNSKIEEKICKINNLAHEHEILICSNAVIKKITEKHGDVIKYRSSIDDGFTDQLFYNLCKVERIHGIHSKLIDSESDILRYLSGYTFHTHGLSPERVEKITDIIDLIIQKEENSKSIFAGKEYILTNKFSNSKEITNINTSLIKFGERGDVIADNLTFKFWREKDNKLQLLDEHFKIAVEFEIPENIEFLKQIPRKVEQFGKKVISEGFLVEQSTTPNN